MKIIVFWVLYLGGLMVIRSPQDTARTRNFLMGQWPYNIMFLGGTAVLAFEFGFPSWVLWCLAIGVPIAFHLYHWTNCV